MKKYLRRADEVFAYQWTPGSSDPLVEECEGEDGEPQGVIRGEEGDIALLDPGDWVVQSGSDGSLWVCSEDQFEAEYVIVPDGMEATVKFRLRPEGSTELWGLDSDAVRRWALSETPLGVFSRLVLSVQEDLQHALACEHAAGTSRDDLDVGLARFLGMCQVLSSMYLNPGEDDVRVSSEAFGEMARLSAKQIAGEMAEKSAGYRQAMFQSKKVHRQMDDHPPTSSRH